MICQTLLRRVRVQQDKLYYVVVSPSVALNLVNKGAFDDRNFCVTLGLVGVAFCVLYYVISQEIKESYIE